MKIKNLIIPLSIIFASTMGYSNDLTSFDSALKLAKETDKPVLIDIFADW